MQRCDDHSFPQRRYDFLTLWCCGAVMKPDSVHAMSAFSLRLKPYIPSSRIEGTGYPAHDAQDTCRPADGSHSDHSHIRGVLRPMFPHTPDSVGDPSLWTPVLASSAYRYQFLALSNPQWTSSIGEDWMGTCRKARPMTSHSSTATSSPPCCATVAADCKLQVQAQTVSLYAQLHGKVYGGRCRSAQYQEGCGPNESEVSLDDC